MISARDQYLDLLILTKQYLLQEHSLTDRLISDPETYTHFRSYAEQKQEIKTSSTTSSQAAVTPQPPLSHCIPKQITTATVKAPIPEAKTAPEPPSIQKNRVQASGNKIEVQPSKSSGVNENGPFKLEPPTELQPANFTDIRKIIQEKFPHVRLLDQVPDDMEAQKLAKIWRLEKKIPQVILLSFDEVPKHLSFLTHIAKALEAHGVSAEVKNAIKLEQEAQWEKLLTSDKLKLVVSSSSGFYHLAGLQKHYKEGTKQGRHYLGDRLLLLLSDISFYFKEPALKSSLWKALKEFLATVSLAL